ncbi:MAG: asparagine synthase (glutamine-hydrolyzing) [Patescibacteria group bacterium]
MCGITGFVGKGSESDVLRMVRSVHHRGPDDQGVYCAEGVGLGHARLSIIDLSPLGHQPMWNASHTVGIVFNGEIYNFLELKKTLVAGGHKFVSTSDTEVIIALYEKDGERCFAKLDGMFAIALYDRQTKKLLLARDRMGKKPLYFGTWGGTLVFGSEPKALLAHPLVKKEINSFALNAYFALDYVPTPLSIWKGMEKLEPGWFLVYEEGNIRKERFWNPDFHETPIAFADALTELDRRLRHAVSSRLISDVPLGIFLSGGLDSSTIAYYAARAKSERGEKIHTFSIGFSEKSFNESLYAENVAKHLDTIHHNRILSGEDSLKVISEIFSRLDEPLADASIIPTYLLSHFTKEHVTVALGGDGGDELFAGYPTFQAERMMGSYRAIPEVLRRGIIMPMITHIPSSLENFSLDFKLKKFLDGAEEESMACRHMRWLGTFNEADRSKLFTKDVWQIVKDENVYKEAERAMAESNAKDERNRLLFAYQRSYMMDQVLVKVDRASMQVALETRAPFLDYELVEFANRLPYAYKLHGFTTKHLLKKLMEGKLPNNIIYRKKQGFSVPVGAWLRGSLRAWAEELLSDEGRAARYGWEIDLRHARRLFVEHLSGKQDHRKKLRNILTFLEWRRRFI